MLKKYVLQKYLGDTGGFEDEIEAPTIRNNNLRELFNAEIINYNQI